MLGVTVENSTDAGEEQKWNFNTAADSIIAFVKIDLLTVVNSLLHGK